MKFAYLAGKIFFSILRELLLCECFWVAGKFINIHKLVQRTQLHFSRPHAQIQIDQFKKSQLIE